jgi:hypothetical protein
VPEPAAAPGRTLGRHEAAPVTDRDDWSAAQNACTAAYLGREGTPRRRVKVRWWTETTRGPDVTGMVALLWTGRRRRPGGPAVFVAVYEPHAPVGAQPFLVVRAREPDLATPGGRGLATVHGDAVPGGALVIESRAGTVVPAEPPAAPGEGAPAWTEVDPAP